ncbi:hypothetical protein PPGU19_063410 (plasmid) [Paraburkholderia sp. PGU19]|nr:hypothetical protein PPGU19_063410 [Paraburkholderia sp. PGU19]
MPLDGIDTQHKEPSWVSNTIKKILKANPQLSTVRQNPIKRTVLTLVAKVFSDNRSEESTPNGLQIDMPLSRGNFADAFPNLTEAWGEIAAMTATEAVKYFRDKAGAARQNLNVIGQPLDERILSFAGPVAVLFVAAYLLCNLLVMRRALVTYEAPTANALLFTWIGLHEKGIPSLVTTASILYLPVMSSISLYIQSAGALDVGKAVGLGATTLTAVCANQALKVTTLLHADLERARSVARGKAGSDRRAAKGNKD